MAGAGPGAGQGPGDVGAPGEAGEAELVARVAALEVSLAGKEAEVAQERERVAGAEAELAAREAEAGRMREVETPNAPAPGDLDWRDWAGLPEELLVKVAETQKKSTR